MSDIIITPASGKIDFYQDLGASSLAKIELTATNDLALSSISGNLIIGDASRDIYIGNGINDVDIIFEQNGEIRPFPAKTLNIGTSGSFTQILASKVNINQNSFTSIPLDVYSSTSGATILNVAGTKGTLFSVTDNLSGSLMSVNNDAGLPVFEVFSDDRIVGGRFGQNDFVMTSGGNVGIGTGVPSSKFHVVGSVLFSSGLSVSGLITSNSGNFINSLTVNSTGVSISGHTHTSSDITNFNSSVSGLVSGIYAPLSSPALIGTPTAPTAPSGTNTTQIASTAFVRTEISNLVASAPTTLDTLNELATALGNDASFSTTVTTNLGGKANLSGATFTGSVSGPSGNFTSLKVNSVDVSANGHTHTSSNITDFNSSVSGLLPTITNSGDNRVLTSTGGSVGVNAESNLTFDGSLLSVTGSGSFSNNVTASGFVKSSGTSSQFLKADGSVDSSTYLTSLSHNHIIADSAGTQQFTFGVNENVRIAGSGSTSIVFNSGTRQVTVSSTDTTYSAGSGLSLTGTTFSHTDTSSQGSVDNSSGTVIQDVTLDTYGHVTALNSINLDGRYYTETEVDTALSAKQATLTNPVTGTGTTSYLPKWTSSSGVGNSLIFDDGTNVGIGTVSPSGKLHVIGSGIFSSGIRVGDSSTNGYIYGPSGNANIQINNAGTNRIDVTATNLYVGAITFLNGNATYVNGTLLFPKSGPATTSIATQSNPNELRFYNGLWNDSSSYDGYNTLHSIASTSVSGASRFAVLMNNGDGTQNRTERLSILSNGNIGIGTTTPQELLHVSGTISSNVGNLLRLNNSSATNNPSINFRIGGVGNYDSHFFISRNGTDVFGIDTQNKGVFLSSCSLYGNQQFFSYNNANAAIKLQNLTTNDLEISAVSGILFQSQLLTKMKMDKDGNFGIGTITPGAKLHVAGDVLATGSFIAGSGSAGNPSFEFTGDTDTGMFAPATNTIALATSGVERLRINSIGNIGIGTSNPSHTLHVAGSGRMDLGLINTTSVFVPVGGTPGSNYARLNVNGAIYCADNGTAGNAIYSSGAITTWDSAQSAGNEWQQGVTTVLTFTDGESLTFVGGILTSFAGFSS